MANENNQRQINMDAFNVVSVLSLIVSFALPYVAWRKLSHDIRQTDASTDNTDADTAEKYQRIANLAAERALGLERRLTQLEDEKIALAVKVTTLETKLAAKDEEIATLRDWAERLVHQVQALGEVPVKLRLAGALLQKGNEKVVQ
jgi:chromosome segregation ATPase